MRVAVGVAEQVPSPIVVDPAGEAVADDELPQCTATSQRHGGDAVALEVVAGEGDGEYFAVVPPQADLDRLTLEWTFTVSGVESTAGDEVLVVGAHYASVAELKKALQQKPNITTRRLLQLRDEFADIAEDYIGATWSTAWEREVVCGALLRWGRVQTPVLSVRSDEGADASASWDIAPSGVVLHVGGYLGRTTVTYEHGAGRPQELRTATVEWVSSTVMRQDGGAGRDVIWQSADGDRRYSTPDRAKGRPTGILSVDTTLNRLAGGDRGPVVG